MASSTILSAVREGGKCELMIIGHLTPTVVAFAGVPMLVDCHSDQMLN